MTAEKLKINLEKLRSQIARKPPAYTSDHAVRITDSFNKYTNTRTVNFVLSYSELLESYGWVFPLFITRETYKKYNLKLLTYRSLLITVKAFGFRFILHLIRNRLSARPKNFEQADFHKLTDEMMVALFKSHKKKIFDYWRNSNLFLGKEHIIAQVEKCYDKGLWIACISTAFPLLDHLMRSYFNTKRFEKDVNHILFLMKQAGITSNDLKPGYRAYLVAKEKGGPEINSVDKKDLRLIGIALGSFVAHAEVYYKYFRKDSFSSTNNDLNRHAVIHCAPVNFNSKINAIKLLIFIDLVLELEPVMKILLNDN